MSILRVDEIRDNGAGFNDVVTFANNGGTENGKLVRAWVNFNAQGTVAIRANFNVNSITDVGTGDFAVNLTNALSDANYSVSGIANEVSANYLCTVYLRTSSPVTTTQFLVRVHDPGVGVFDAQFNCFSVFR